MTLPIDGCIFFFFCSFHPNFSGLISKLTFITMFSSSSKNSTITQLTLNRRFLVIVGVLIAARIHGFQPQRSFVRPTAQSTTACHAFALEGAVSAVESFFQSEPYVAALLTCSVKASAADFMAQTKQSEALPSDDEYSVNFFQNLVFLLYGGLYQGLAQQFMYSNLFPDLFGNGMTWQSVAMQVGFDMAIVGPFLCLPIAYAVKGVFTADDKLSFQTVLDGLDKYVEDVMIRGLLLKYWALWVPVQTLTFGSIPQHFRVTFVAAVSFF
jgi:hypothetical protein